MFSIKENTELTKLFPGKRVYDFSTNDLQGRLFFRSGDSVGTTPIDLTTVSVSVQQAIERATKDINETMADAPLLVQKTHFSQRLSNLLSTVNTLSFDSYNELH